MTAVVAILNKTGIALAADSAVTVTNGVYNASKIYNTANKLFMLSKRKPIGIMIYSSAEFMGIPWELIIKVYRKELGDRSFDTVYKYKEDFINFLESNNMFDFPKRELGNVKKVTMIITSSLMNEISEKLQGIDIGSLDQDQVRKYVIQYLSDVLSSHLTTSQEQSKLKLTEYLGQEQLSTETTDAIINSFKKTIIDWYSFLENEDLEPCEAQIVSLVFNILTCENFYFGSTGLVFSGYGNQEIYPALHSIEVAGTLSSKLLVKDTDTVIIDEENSASIVPFAQKDVMTMYIEGIHPHLEQVILESFGSILSEYNKEVSNMLCEDDQKKLQNIDLDELVSEFGKLIFLSRMNNQVKPTIDTVNILSKEDLAEMAESLIYLTFLKQKTSSSEESVGGAIDVAIISKGDGFIWKNRKHYFEKELNQHFFSNYFQ